MTQHKMLDAAALPSFDGDTYEPELDRGRLARQLDLVRNLMADGAWRTLAEISAGTGAPQASVSARLRDLRKRKYGAWSVQRRRRGEPRSGLFEYRVVGGQPCPTAELRKEAATD